MKSLDGSESFRLLCTYRHPSHIMTTLKRGQLLDRKINSPAPSHARYLWKHRVRTQYFLLCCSAITYPTHSACCSSPLPPVSHLAAHTPPCILPATSHAPKFHTVHPLLLPAAQNCWAVLKCCSETMVVIINPIKDPLVPQSFPRPQVPPQGFSAELQTQDIGLTTLEAKGRIWPLQWPVYNISGSR